MLWTDLEVGDKLRFKQEVKNHYSQREPQWVLQWCDKTWETNSLDIEGERININFNPKGRFAIGFDGKVFGWTYNGILFDIVELKEEI